MTKKEDKHHPDYKGDLTAKNLRDGPLQERKCTDLLCLLFFLVFWGGIGTIGFLSFKKGTPMELTYAYDQAGSPCGQGSREDYKMLLFIYDSGNTKKHYSTTNTICTKSCPNGQGGALECYSGSDLNENGKMCDNQHQYKTLPFFDRFCLPTEELAKLQLSDEGFNMDSLSTTTSDMMATWPMIFAVGGFALVFGFVYIVLMKYFSGVLVWGILAVTVLGSAGVGTMAFLTKHDPNGNAFAKLPDSALKAIAYSCWAFSGLFFLLVICLRDRIRLSIAVLKAAAHFIEDEPGIFVLPPIFFVLTLAFYALWIMIAAFIVGMNEIKPAVGGKPYANIKWNSTAGGLLTYHFFALLWNHAFGIALSQFIIASAACLWYFKQGTKKSGVSVVGSSIKRSVTHMGSLAFGSFLIGLLEFIRYMLKFVEQRVKAVPAAAVTGDAVKAGFCLACCSCVVGCFERSMKFLTNHAYIQIAMTGESFCTATSEAFFLSLRNAARFGLVHGFAGIFLKLGQIIISGSATVLGYVIITQAPYYTKNVVSPVIPTILFFISSYVVAHSFMTIYGMSAETIVHCFAMDEEIHDGQVVHAPQEIKEYLDDHMSKKLLVED